MTILTEYAVTLQIYLFTNDLCNPTDKPLNVVRHSPHNVATLAHRVEEQKIRVKIRLRNEDGEDMEGKRM